MKLFVEVSILKINLILMRLCVNTKTNYILLSIHHKKINEYLKQNADFAYLNWLNVKDVKVC